MSFVKQLFQLLGLELDELQGVIRRDLAYFGALAALAAIALVFLMVALYLGLALFWGPLIAALVIAGAALLIALVMVGLKTASDRARERRALEAKRAAEKTALVTTAAMSALPMIAESPVLRKAALPLGSALLAFWLLLRPKKDDPDSQP